MLLYYNKDTCKKFRIIGGCVYEIMLTLKAQHKILYTYNIASFLFSFFFLMYIGKRKTFLSFNLQNNPVVLLWRILLDNLPKAIQLPLLPTVAMHVKEFDGTCIFHPEGNMERWERGLCGALLPGAHRAEIPQCCRVWGGQMICFSWRSVNCSDMSLWGRNSEALSAMWGLAVCQQRAALTIGVQEKWQHEADLVMQPRQQMVLRCCLHVCAGIRTCACMCGGQN